jgi:hypothetical protein
VQCETLGRELVVERLVGDRLTLRSGQSVWSGRLVRLASDRLQLTTPRGVVVIERVR